MPDYRFRAPGVMYDDEYYLSPFAPENPNNPESGPQGFYGNGLGVSPDNMGGARIIQPRMGAPSDDEWTDKTGRPPYTGSQERYHNPEWDLRSKDAMLEDPLIRALMKRRGIG